MTTSTSEGDSEYKGRREGGTTRVRLHRRQRLRERVREGDNEYGREGTSERVRAIV